MLSLIDLTDGSSPLVEPARGAGSPPRSVARVKLARTAAQAAQAADALVVVDAKEPWLQDKDVGALFCEAAGVLVVGDSATATELAALVDAPVLVPTGGLPGGAVEVWGRLHERIATDALRRADRADRLAEIVAAQVGSGAAGVEALLDESGQEVGARVRLFTADSDPADWDGDLPEIATVAARMPGPVALRGAGSAGHVLAVAAGRRSPRPVLIAERAAAWESADVRFLEQVAQAAAWLAWTVELDGHDLRLVEAEQEARERVFHRLLRGTPPRAVPGLEALAPGLAGVGSGTVAVIETALAESRQAFAVLLQRTVGRRALVVLPSGTSHCVVISPEEPRRLSELIGTLVRAAGGRAAGLSPLTRLTLTAAAHKAAASALVVARGTTSRVVIHDGRAKLAELLGTDAQIFAALLLQSLGGLDQVERDALCEDALETLWWGTSKAEPWAGYERKALGNRLRRLTDRLGLDDRNQWHRAVLYLALRLDATTDKSRPLIPDRPVTLDEALTHPDAREWAHGTLKGLTGRLRHTLVTWAQHDLSARAAQEALGIKKTEFHRRKNEASEATQLDLSLPGPKLELLMALYIAGDVTMGAIDISSRALDAAAAERGAEPVADETGHAQSAHVGEDFDTTTPDASRVYGFFLGEKENYPADREAAAKLAAVWPDTETACRTSRAFVLRAAEHATSKGVRQIIDMGCGILTKASDNVHQVAQRILPSARVAYVDKNPLVRRYCERDLDGVDGCVYLHHDFLAGAALYEHPQFTAHLNLHEPVTLLLGNLLHFVPGEIAYHVVADLVRPLAPGSRLVIASIASDLRPTMMEKAVANYSGRVTTSFARNREEIARFFEGLRLEEPGIVTPPQWHSNPGDVIPSPHRVCTWAAVGVVP